MSCQGVTSKILGIFVPKNHYLCNDLSLIYDINSVVPSLTNPFRVISLAGPIVLRPITTFCFHSRLAPASTISSKGGNDSINLRLRSTPNENRAFVSQKNVTFFEPTKISPNFLGQKYFSKNIFSEWCLNIWSHGAAPGYINFITVRSL